MAEKTLSKTAFLSVAASAGLDIQDPHMDQLYEYVRQLLSSLKPDPGNSVETLNESESNNISSHIKRVFTDMKPISDLDLDSVEPATIFVPFLNNESIREDES